MSLNFSKYAFAFILGTLLTLSARAQAETSEWKFQISFGINSPSDDNNSDNYFSKSANFPSINLGIQHMFSRSIGAKLDYGYNRATSDNRSDEFKFNYSRINAQLVYDFKSLINFLPPPMTIVAHVGPGVSFTKPLGNFSDNTYTFLNLLGGMEIHVGVAQTVSVYGDLSYVLGLSNAEKYDPAVDGFSFNGDLLYVSLGVSVSLSGCYYCE